MQKLNFISLAAKAGRKCGNGTSHLTKNWQSRSKERISCHIIGSQAKWKCGSRISDLWQSYQVGRVDAELYIFDRSLSYWLPLPMLTNNPTDYYNCHSQWRAMWRHKIFAMLLKGHYAPARTLGNIDLGPILGPSYKVENSPSDWRVDPIGSLVPAAFGHDACLMSGSLSYVSWFVTAW